MTRISYAPVTNQQLRADILAVISAGEYLDKPLTFSGVHEAIVRRCGPQTDIERVHDLLLELMDSEIIARTVEDYRLVFRIVRRTI